MSNAFENNDLRLSEDINKYCKRPFKITAYKTLPSTNTMLKQLADSGANEGRVVVANEQTKGRGRLGRSFFSPWQSGIYMSVLLQPKIDVSDAMLITTAAAVAIVRAIYSVTRKQADIKWVNDVFINGKKICGILTESSIDFESRKMKYAVLGIGLNLFKPEDDFPEELKGIANSVFNKKYEEVNIKSKLCAAILNEFFDIYENIADRSFMSEYKKHCFILGKSINVISNGDSIHAVAIDVNEDAHLIVKLDDGSIKELSSGEISIRI